MFSKKNSDHIDMVIAAIMAKYAGQTVHNAELKDYLIATLPELFPSGRADGCIEFLAKVDFSSTMSKKSGVQGIAFLDGVKEGGKRYWNVPATLDNVVAKGDCAELDAPLPTKKRVNIRFGEYVARQKQEEQEGE